MAFPPRFLDDLRARLSASEVIGKRLKLTRAGREYKACCPFHNEKTPSFYINDDKGFFHCFGCGAHGDILGFVMRHDNLSFTEAVEQLAGQAGMPVPALRPEDIVKAKQEKDYYSLLEAATAFFGQQLGKTANAGVHGYLTGRGLSQDIIAAFRLGYAPAEDKMLVRTLLEQGFNEEQLLQAGLARRSTRDNSLYGFFRDRVMFPITDRRGRVLAFSGRILPDHLQRLPKREGADAPPKYINSAESSYFQKRQHLFGEAQARVNVTDHSIPLVVEGQVDVIACHQAGFKTAVAPLGTALTEDQITALWKMCMGPDKRAIVCFDGDNAGRKAAGRALERVLPLLKPRHTLQFVFLPPGEDPDSMLQKGQRDAFAAMLETPISLAEYLWQVVSEGQDLANPELRAAVEVTWGEHIAKIPDQTLQYHLKRHLKDKLYAATAQPQRERQPYNYNYKGGQSRLGPGGFNYRNQPPRINVTVPNRPVAASEALAQKVLLLTVLRHPWLLTEIESDLAGVPITDPDLSAVQHGLLDWFGTITDPADLVSEAAQTYLTQAGLAEALAPLQAASLQMHARFAKEGQEPDKVREGWRSIFDSLMRAALVSDVEAAKQQLKADYTPESENRLLAMRRLWDKGADAGDK